MEATFPAFYETMTTAERAEWAAMAAPTLTTEELAGLETFRTSIEDIKSGKVNTTPFQVELRLKALRSGEIAKRKGAPRQEVIDAMIAMMAEYGYK